MEMFDIPPLLSSKNTWKFPGISQLKTRKNTIFSLDYKTFVHLIFLVKSCDQKGWKYDWVKALSSGKSCVSLHDVGRDILLAVVTRLRDCKTANINAVSSVKKN